MAVHHADTQALTVMKYFAQSMTVLYEIHKLQDPADEWLPALEELCTSDVYFKFFRQPKHRRRFLSILDFTCVLRKDGNKYKKRS